MKMEVEEIVGYEETYDIMVKCPNENCQEGVYLGSNYCPQCGLGLRYNVIKEKVKEKFFGGGSKL